MQTQTKKRKISIPLVIILVLLLGATLFVNKDANLFGALSGPKRLDVHTANLDAYVGKVVTLDINWYGDWYARTENSLGLVTNTEHIVANIDEAAGEDNFAFGVAFDSGADASFAAWAQRYLDGTSAISAEPFTVTGVLLRMDGDRAQFFDARLDAEGGSVSAAIGRHFYVKSGYVAANSTKSNATLWLCVAGLLALLLLLAVILPLVLPPKKIAAPAAPAGGMGAYPPPQGQPYPGQPQGQPQPYQPQVQPQPYQPQVQPQPYQPQVQPQPYQPQGQPQPYQPQVQPQPYQPQVQPQPEQPAAPQAPAGGYPPQQG